MKSILNVQVQKLFLVTLILKVGSSFFGWYLQLPWSLGFIVPLFIMVSYIVLGYFRRESNVSDEKFADTCYYLGFIFTITSIIFSLFDLPNIGTKIQDIAVRFGAAMVSTVLGLSVRVYLVSFKEDIGDALTSAEDAILDATRKFTEQLTIALEKLRGFETQVDAAAQSSVESVKLQVENLSRNHAEKLAGFFTELTTHNQKAFTSALAEVNTASQRLANSVDGYSQGMRSNLTSIETKVGAFTEAVTDRLKSTTFPDEYFAKQLEAPLGQLRESATGLAREVKQVSAEVNQSSVVLSSALKKIREKANATEGSLDTVLRLTAQQQAVLDSAQGQLTTMGQLATNLANFDTALTSTLAGITASNVVTSELTSRVSSVVEEGAAARKSLGDSLEAVIGKLDLSTVATTTVASKLDAHATANMAVATMIGEKLDTNSLATKTAAAAIAFQLETSTAATESVNAKLGATAAASDLIAGKLDGITAADIEAATTLGLLGEHAFAAIGKVDEAVVQLHVMVHQLSALDTALRTQSSELKLVADQIKDVKVVVEMPQPVSSHTLEFLPRTQSHPVGLTPLLPASETEDYLLNTDDDAQLLAGPIAPVAKSAVTPNLGA